jgi:hypothetical protein
MPKEQTERIMANMSKVLGEDIEQRTTESLEKFDEVLEAQARAEKFCISIALDQDYLAASKLVTAFARAMVRKPNSPGDIGRTNTVIYMVLMMQWQHVETLGSIPALHRMLCKHVLLKSSMVGNLKRVEKICERIGLSYREIAQRNNRAGHPDMTVSSLSGDKTGGTP